MMECLQCGKQLDAWDVGFYKKLVNRGATDYRCIPCTARYFGLSEDTAWEMIRRFQAQGCTLFPPPKKE